MFRPMPNQVTTAGGLIGKKAYSSAPQMSHPFFSKISPYIERSGGETYLHHLARQGCAATVNDFTSQVSEESASGMAKMTNDEGDLPFDVLQQAETSRFTLGEKENFRSKLYSLMKANTIKTISEKVDEEQVLSRYLSNTQLNRNLRIACALVNKTRDAITDSSSHPQSNYYSVERKAEVVEKIINMRVAADEAIERVGANSPVDQARIYANVARQHGVGNCDEFASYAWSFLSDTYGSSFSEIYRVNKGDHVFVVIDRGAESHASNYRTWKNEAVVCDITTGEVFLSSEIEQRLTAHRSFTLDKLSYIHAQVSFNPNYHRLEPKVSTLINNAEQREKAAQCASVSSTACFFARPKNAPHFSAEEALSNECRKSAYF